MNNNLAVKILISLVFGVLAGSAIQFFGAADGIARTWLVDGLFYAAGTMFVGMIKLLVVPLIFISIVNAVCSLEDIG